MSEPTTDECPGICQLTGEHCPPECNSRYQPCAKARAQQVWTEGVCGDGAMILRDGVPVPIEDVVSTLNELSAIRHARKRAAVKREPTGYNLHGETMAEYYQRRTNERGADIEMLRTAIREALDLMRNPHDGAEYEDGEVPAVDVLRKALAEVKG